MIRENLKNNVTIKNFLDQHEITEKISDLCNITTNISSDLHMRQKTDLNFSDQSVLTENFYINLSKKIKKKKNLNSTKFIYKSF